jgi:hypothetical protein
MDKQTEVAVDVGGGKGEFFLKRALAEPQKVFVVLDPQIEQISGKPDNLFLIKWKSDRDANLPIKPNSVDEVNISMLMGELITSDVSDANNVPKHLEKEFMQFRRILKETKSMLKSDGIVTVIEPRANMDYALRLLADEGYKIIKPASKVEDKNRSAFVGMFFDLFQHNPSLNKKSEETSLIIPLEVKAQVIK